MKVRSSSTQYIPPIDGLRAIAVFAVILYHLGIQWIPGGFLGVDLFFVISGYVITRLILDSINRSSALDLKAFYTARIRRLIPNLVVVIISSAFIAAVWAPEAAKRLISDIPFVLTGTNNWRLVALHQDYFASVGRPPLLQHTWSLAVEAQFYLVWPVILILILRYFGLRNITRFALGIATVSGIALFIYSLRVDSTNSQRISHIYFGTDTHSLGLFLGAALAVSWIPQNLSTKISQRAQDFVDGIGVIGLLGILSCFLFIDESNPTLYKLAFPLAGLFGCAVITSIVHPSSRFAPIMSSTWLLWIGERSYGIYLWHWIIFQVTRPTVDLAGSAFAVNSARILCVLALSDLTFRFVEIPFRSGAVQTWFRGMKYRALRTRRKQQFLVAMAVFVTLTFGSTSAIVGISRGNEVSSNLQKEIAKQGESSLPPAFDTKQKRQGLWVTGDSVILGIRSKLEARSHIALINARVGRQIQELITVVRQDQPQVTDDPVILDLGNNNHLTTDSVVELLDLLKNQPKIVLVNTAVPRTYRDDNNRIINEVAKRYSNVVLVDWNQISKGHPEFFAEDGVHLSDSGSDVYVAAILEALN